MAGAQMAALSLAFRRHLGAALVPLVIATSMLTVAMSAEEVPELTTPLPEATPTAAPPATPLPLGEMLKKNALLHKAPLQKQSPILNLTSIGQLVKAFGKFRLNETGVYKNGDIPVTGWCKDAHEHLCPTVVVGDARMANCLRDAEREAVARKEKSPLSTTCRRQVSAFFAFASRIASSGVGNQSLIPVDIVPGFREACMTGARQFCSPAASTDKVRILPCLKKHKGSGDLSKLCEEKLLLIQGHEAKNMLLDAPFTEACQADLQKIPLCRDAPLHALRGTGAQKACLRRHRAELSSKCRDRLFVRMQEDAQDFRLDADAHAACRKEIADFCKLIDFGNARMAKCLWRSKHLSGFSSGCRLKIEQKTKTMMSDYRLDFRLRKQCKEDIVSLCETEKEIRTTENRSEGNSSAGIVIHCLKASYKAIKADECKREVRRVVRVHATHPHMNPVHTRSCGADVQRFCSAAAPRNVHSCLRKHLEELSTECKDVELLQGSLEARDISMKPAMKTACEGGIKEFCKDVPEGDAQIINCLQGHLQKTGQASGHLPASCSELVKADLEASQHDLRLKFGVSEVCAKDAESFCSDYVYEGGLGLITCLKRKVNELQSLRCNSEVMHYVGVGTLSIAASPLTYSACFGDVDILCGSVKPGQGRVHACLLENRADLSTKCAVQEFEEEALQAKDIRMSPLTMSACADAMKKLCADVQMGEGAMWRCLEDKKNSLEMAWKCRQVVTAHIKLKNTEYHLNPSLSKHCKVDAETLCPDVLEKADSKDFTSGGLVISCLIQKRSEVKDDHCRADVLRKQKQRTSDIKNSPEAFNSCKEDIDTYCEDVKSGGVGGVHECLEKNIAELSLPCKVAELGNVMARSRDVRLNPGVMKFCKSESKLYCSDKEPGDGHVMDCLLAHMHDKDFGGDCRKHMEKEQKLRSTSIVFTPSLLNKCKTDYEGLVKSNKCPAANFNVDLNHPDLPTFPAVPSSAMQSFGMQGQMISCLTKRRTELKAPGCQRAVLKQLRRESNDIRAKPGMWEACKNDVETLCSEAPPGRGRMHFCLREKKAKIQNKACLDMVLEVAAAEGEDATINPLLVMHCREERRTFCSGIEHGDGRVLACLQKHVKEDSFSEQCRSAWNKHMIHVLTKNLTKSFKGMKKGMDATDVLAWLEKNGHFEQRGGIVTGAVVGSLVTLAFAAVCYWAMQRRSKTDYATVKAYS